MNRPQAKEDSLTLSVPVFKSLAASAVCGRWLAGAMILTGSLAAGQEAMRNSIAGDAAAEARRIQPGSRTYNFKTGDLRLRVIPSAGVDGNDNINASKDNKESDVILRPGLGLGLSYPITQRNLLELNVNVGYLKYLNHDALSTWTVQSGSELSFDIFVEDFQINLHDRVSYVQDSAQEAAIAGTARYGNINNTAGVLTSWGLKDMTFSLGYDHATVISPASEFSYQDRASELFIGRTGYRFQPTFTAGVEGTVSLTRYDKMVLNDNNNYSAGVYADWQPGTVLHVQPRAGYTITHFQQTSQSGISTADLNSWYADLSITHAVSEAISYTLSAGHEVRLGVQGADAIEDWYVRPAMNWTIIRNLPFQTFLSYEHGNQGVGNQAGNLTETYDYFGGGFGLSHPITARLNLGLNYRVTVRNSTTASRGYTQNVVSLQLSYNPG
ncbi:MAG: hypothetical protein QOJ40_1562 [Verrucomicrobiota bacterium]